ncbi:MAG: hypothetical protein H6648_08605 [Caldilineae bacterium]|nr:hypothetical protein [Caldilineae bacterium]
MQMTPGSAARALLAIALLGLLLGRVAPEGTRARPLDGLDGGAWATIANGDDILALVWSEGVLWAGTRAGGLVRWDPTEGSYVQILAPQQPLPSNTVRDLAVGDDGRVWVATSRGLGVVDDGGTADLADDVWHTYTRENTAGGLPSDDLRALAIDGNLVWVGGAQLQDSATGAWSEGGVGRLDTAGTPDFEDDLWAEPITYASTLIGAPDGSERLGLVSDNVNALALTSTGGLWVGTGPHWILAQAPDPDDPPYWQRVHGGISYLDTAGTPDMGDDTWHGTSCQDVQVTVTCNIQAIAIDAQDRGWAAIQGRGLLFFDATRERIPDDISRRFEMPDRPVGDTVEAIAVGPADDPDLANTVWVGRSRGGVTVLDHKGTPTIRRDDVWNFDRGDSFTTADGLPRERVQALTIGGGTAWVGTGPELGRAGGIGPIGLFDLTIGQPLLTDKAPPTNFISDIGFGDAGSRWDGHVWIATGSLNQPLFGAGVADLDTAGTLGLGDDSWRQFTMENTDADGKAPWTGLAGNNVHAVLPQGDRVWFGSLETIWNASKRVYENGGLSVFDGEAWTLRNIENTGGASAGLRDASVSALAAGCDGSVWVGTGNRSEGWGGGVDQLTPGASVHQRTQDQWRHFEFPTLASNNTTDIDVDCAAGEVWVSSAHHQTLPDSMGSPGGRLVGGGVARYDIAADRWTKSDTRQGLESFASGTIYAEAMSVMGNGDGRAWVGAYGSRAMSQADLVNQRPYWPAPINLGAGDSWTHRLLARGGMVRSIARDAEGRVWVGTSRGGAARDSATPDSWREDRELAGLHIYATPDPASEPVSLAPANSLVTANDVSVIAVAPGGEVWVGTEGWGIMRYDPKAAAATPTTVVRPPATPTPRPATATPTATLTGRASATATVERTPTRKAGTDVAGRIHLPFLAQRRQGS